MARMTLWHCSDSASHSASVFDACSAMSNSTGMMKSVVICKSVGQQPNDTYNVCHTIYTHCGVTDKADSVCFALNCLYYISNDMSLLFVASALPSFTYTFVR
jgi:hypothetical protein